jgi:hypothetical protein
MSGGGIVMIFGERNARGPHRRRGEERNAREQTHRTAGA